MTTRLPGIDTEKDRWLQQHGAAEHRLTMLLNAFFIAQANRILEAIFDHDQPSPATVEMEFNLETERRKLAEIVAPSLIEFMALGANDVWSQARRPNPTKSFNESTIGDFKLPPRVKQAIGVAFTELEVQPYWIDIQKTTRTKLTEVLEEGIDEGLNGWDLRKEINEALGGLSKVRAGSIARTETTLAFNAGHQSSYSALADDGTIRGKEWLSIIDGHTRGSHKSANKQQVGPNDDFKVGGWKAPYPGHWSLPAAERVRCRCTTTAVF